MSLNRDFERRRECCPNLLFLFDQMCHDSPPTIFQCRSYGEDWCVNHWQVSVMSPILMSGQDRDGRGLFVIFQTNGFKNSVTLRSRDLVYS